MSRCKVEYKYPGIAPFHAVWISLRRVGRGRVLTGANRTKEDIQQRERERGTEERERETNKAGEIVR